MSPQPETVEAQIVGASFAWTGPMHLLTLNFGMAKEKAAISTSSVSPEKEIKQE